MNRLNSDFNRIKNHGIPDIILNVQINENDKYRGHIITIKGPKDTPYEKGVFDLSVDFPKEYPFIPPTIKFINRIFHPNIDMNGNICIDILKDQWASSISLTSIIISLSDLLQNPNPDDPLNIDAGNIYKKNKEQFNKTVNDYIKKYCNYK
jgi:ubiquitin-conjugating enzyme E2 D/E